MVIMFPDYHDSIGLSHIDKRKSGDRSLEIESFLKVDKSSKSHYLSHFQGILVPY
jgi:hypothetical protein